MKKKIFTFFIAFIFCHTICQAQLVYKDSMKVVIFPSLWTEKYRLVDTIFADSIADILALKGFKNALLKDSIISVLALGDSRVQQPTIMEPLREKLIGIFGYAGIGYYAPWDYYPRGIVSCTGTQTIIDQQNEGLWGLQGQVFRLDATNEQYNEIITNSDFTGAVKTLKIHYLATPNGGKFRLLLNGKVIDTINTKSGGNKTFISSYSYKKNNQVTKGGDTIRTEAVTFNSVILGFDFRNGKKGILFNRCGNGTATTEELWKWNSTNSVSDYFAKELKPSLIISLMGVNRADEIPPVFEASHLFSTFQLYRKYTTDFSIIMLGETGEKISDEQEDNINLAYYLTAKNYKDQIMFVNLKDIVKNWASFATIQNNAWTIGDNVHWGKNGGLLAANYIWYKMKSGDLKQQAIFPRIYSNTKNDTTFCDVAKNSNTAKGFLNLTFLDFEFPPANIIVKINGVFSNHFLTNKKPYWINKGTIIESVDINGKIEVINTIEIEIKP